MTDFTDLLYAGGIRKAQLMPVVGHETNMAYGWAVGPHRNRELALRAWARAKDTFRQMGIARKGMIIHHDRDSVYLSYEWLRELLIEDRVRISYALRGATDSTMMEAFNSSFKREGESLFVEAADVAGLREVVAGQMRYYNRERRHSALGYESPVVYTRSLRRQQEEL